MASDELKDQRVVTMMSPGELKEIDDWSFKHRIRSRGEAIRRLCQIGISQGEDIRFLEIEVDVLQRKLSDTVDRLHALVDTDPSIYDAYEKSLDALLLSLELMTRLRSSISSSAVKEKALRLDDDLSRAVDMVRELREQRSLLLKPYMEEPET